MKNIAIPLLLANSAKADDNAAKKKAMMKLDNMVPAPTLIATEYFDGACVDPDGAVAAAATAMASAEDALQLAIDARAPFAEAVEEAKTAKNDAIDAVIDAETAMKDDLQADDAAQQAEIVKKRALDEADINLAISELAQQAAVDALEAAQDADDEAQDVLQAMLEAKNAAATHLEAEQEETETVEGNKDEANETHESLNGELPDLLDLYEDAKETYEGTLATTEEKKAEWDELKLYSDKLGEHYTTAANDLLEGTAESTAALKKVQDDILDNTDDDADDSSKRFLLNEAAAAWTAKAKLTVEAMALWLQDEDVDNSDSSFATKWVDVGSDAECDGFDDNKHQAWTADGDENTNWAKCAAKCAALPAAAMTDGLPTGITDSWDGDNSTIGNCYAVSLKVGTSCHGFGTALVSTADGDTAADIQCKKRLKSSNAAGLKDANDLSKTSDTLYTDMTTALDNWADQSAVVDGHIRLLKIATEYKDLLLVVKEGAADDDDDSGWDGFTQAASDDYDAAKEASDEDQGEMDGKKETYDEKVEAVEAALNTLNQLTTQLELQQAEEEAQEAIKALADTDYDNQVTAQEGTAEALEAATGEKEDADADLEEKTETQATAQEEYEAAQEEAVATGETIAEPVENLVALRGTAAETIETLNEKIEEFNGQEDVISDARDLLAEKTDDHLTAVVLCKEARYDEYAAALADAIATRNTNLGIIEGLVDDAIAAIPAPNTVGARCEKARSNGTFRPQRNPETICGGEANCCGAARIPVPNADGTDSDTIMTIETCQTKETAEFEWAPPRGPMETEMPTPKKYPFTCIEGAQKLAAAASALAAAVYMLA